MADLEPMPGGELLKRYRIGAGLTQEELAERAGLSARAIRALESGAHRTPRRDTLNLLATALALSSTDRNRLELSMRQRSRPSASTSASVTPTRPQPPLVGRQRERERIARFLGDASDTPLLLVAGQPGIGKTRLLEEAARQAQALGWPILKAGCHRRSAQQPYSPFVEALTRFLSTRSDAQRRLDAQGCAWLVRLLPELSQTTLAPSLAWTLSPEQERRLMFAAVARLLANISGDTGALLLLDDLHWAGVDALDLLGSLLREPHSVPIRVIAAYRDTDVAAGDPLPMLLGDLAREELAVSVPLAPLDHANATQLLAALLSDAPDSLGDAESRLLSRAGGVPFYLVSCAQEARVSAQTASGERPFTVPWSAAESIRQRAILLGGPARDILTLAAVAEHALPRAALLSGASALGHDEQTILSALEETIHARLMIETAGGAYRMTHDLIWETLAFDLTGARRAALHRAIADALERLPPTQRRDEELAWHFSQGDALARALPYAIQAGDHAEATYANHEAAAHYTTAATWAQTLGDQAGEGAALEKFAQVAYRMARYNEAFDALTRAASIYRASHQWERLIWATTEQIRMADPLHTLEAALAQVYTLVAELTAAADGGDHAPIAEPLGSVALTTDQLLARIERIATLVSPGAVARLLLCLTSRLLFSGRYAETLTPSEQTIHYAHLARNLRVESLAYAFRSEAQLAQGLVEEASESAELGRQCGMESGDLEAVYVALEARVNIHETQAEPAQAIATLREMQEICRRFGDTTYLGDTSAALAAYSFLVGVWDDARHYLADASGAKRYNEFHRWRSPESILAALDLAQQSPSAGERTGAQDIAAGHIWIWTLTGLAERDILSGRADVAVGRLRQIIAQSQDNPGSACYLLAPLAWAQLVSGQRDDAVATLALARDTAARLRNRMALVDIERTAAHLAIAEGRWDDARRALDASLALCAAMPYPYAEAKARLLAGDIEANAQQPQQARAHYEQALAICVRLSERLYRARIEEALRRLSGE